MSVTLESVSTVSSSAADLHPYRAVSRSAVLSLVLGVVSLLSYIFASLLVLPAVGLILGIMAYRTVRRYPDEYTGGRMALAGAALCGLVLVGATATHAYVYATEVPDGYIRVGFWDLQPDLDHPELPIPPKAIELAGKPIFIKGYMHPGVASMGKVNHFIIVPDMGTCCFGGQPKPTDMIEVKVPPGGERFAYSRTRIKLTGTFGVSQPRKSLGLDNVWYHLDATSPDQPAPLTANSQPHE
jgi:hypothetical protein